MTANNPIAFEQGAIRRVQCRIFTILKRLCATKIASMNQTTLEQRLTSLSTDGAEKPLSPQPILEAVYGSAISRALSTAVELDLFTRIAEDRNTLDALHRDTGCSIAGLSKLLDTRTVM